MVTYPMMELWNHIRDSIPSHTHKNTSSASEIDAEDVHVKSGWPFVRSNESSSAGPREDVDSAVSFSGPRDKSDGSASLLSVTTRGAARKNSESSTVSLIRCGQDERDERDGRVEGEVVQQSTLTLIDKDHLLASLVTRPVSLHLVYRPRLTSRLSARDLFDTLHDGPFTHTYTLHPPSPSDNSQSADSLSDALIPHPLRVLPRPSQGRENRTRLPRRSPRCISK